MHTHDDGTEHDHGPTYDGPTCKTCRWSLHQPTDGEQPVLVCRRMPPTLFMQGVELRQGWPLVFPEHWCGEYRPRTP